MYKANYKKFMKGVKTMVVVYAEKSDVGTKLAAILGGCIIDNKEMTIELLKKKEYWKLVKQKQAQYGYLKCKYKGKDYIITWGYGHLCELKDAKDYNEKYKMWREENFPFIPDKFELKIKDSVPIKKQFTIVKNLFNNKKTEYIINATDLDREGELVFDYVYRMSGSKTMYKRLCIHSFVNADIINGFENLKSSYEMKNLTNAARSRAVADFMLGSNLTAIATLKYGGKENIISIGRVITPVLSMLVERENKIQNFVPETYYSVEGTFQLADGHIYKGLWKEKGGSNFEDIESAKNLINKLITKNGYIKEYEEKEYKKKPPLLYDLTALQMDANAKYGLSGKETLAAAQRLYLNQYISYPRTSSRYIYTSMEDEIKKILKSLPSIYLELVNGIIKNVNADNKRVFDDEKIESHYALIPTEIAPPEDLAENEQKVYGLIARSVIKAFMPENVWKKIKYVTKIDNQLFVTRQMIEIGKGWKIAERKADEDVEVNEFDSVELDTENNDNINSSALSKKTEGPNNEKIECSIEEDPEEYIPVKEILKLGEGNIISNIGYGIIEKTTKRPPRYTEKSLLYAMQTCGKIISNDELRDALKDRGIGTASTRAEIIEKLINLGYIDRIKRTLMPTTLGKKIIREMPLEEIKSIELTAIWEYELNQVEIGKLPVMSFYNEIKNKAIEMTEILKAENSKVEEHHEIGNCPMENCAGKILSNKKGYGCSKWKEGCQIFIWKSFNGKEITNGIMKALLEKKETGLLSGFIYKNGKTYSAKLKLENGKIMFSNN